jgi:hypothetical protein
MVDREQTGRTWVVPDDGSGELGVLVSTIRFAPDYYETMIVGSSLEGTAHISETRKEALETHSFWVNYLMKLYDGVK